MDNIGALLVNMIGSGQAETVQESITTLVAASTFAKEIIAGLEAERDRQLATGIHAELLMHGPLTIPHGDRYDSHLRHIGMQKALLANLDDSAPPAALVDAQFFINGRHILHLQVCAEGELYGARIYKTGDPEVIESGDVSDYLDAHEFLSEVLRPFYRHLRIVRGDQDGDAVGDDQDDRNGDGGML